MIVFLIYVGAGCKNFRCLNDLCISQNLTCDGVNHCGDNSDETSEALCGGKESKSALYFYELEFEYVEK